MNAITKAEKIKQLLFTFLMVAIGLVIIIPLLIVILGSFKTSAETLVPNLKLPKQWLLSNYVYVYEKGKIGRALLNSIFLTTVVVFVCLTTSALCAFTISRRSNRYTKAADVLFKMGMIAPMSVIPTILLIQKLSCPEHISVQSCFTRQLTYLGQCLFSQILCVDSQELWRKPRSLMVAARSGCFLISSSRC